MTTATATPATTIRSADVPTRSRTAPLWRAGLRAGALAAAATTAVASVAVAAGVPLEVDGERIPLAGFAQMTLLCTVLGFVLAKALARWARTPQRTFTATAVALTLLSFVPDLLIAATPATKTLLIVTHVTAAAIVIPAVAARLSGGASR